MPVILAGHKELSLRRCSAEQSDMQVLLALVHSPHSCHCMHFVAMAVAAACDKPVHFAAGGAGGNPTYAALQGADAAWAKIKGQEVPVLASTRANLVHRPLVSQSTYSQHLLDPTSLSPCRKENPRGLVQTLCKRFRHHSTRLCSMM